MTIAQNIFFGIGLLYGLIQTAANTYHFFSKNGIKTGRKQHGEIPKTATDSQIRKKVLFMLLSGIMFLGLSLFTIISGKFMYYFYLAAFSILSIYVLIEAVFYNYWKTYCAFSVSLVLVVMYVIFA